MFRLQNFNQRKAGVLLSYIDQGVQILTGLIYTPVMLRLLGQNEYGLYQLVYSVVSYLGLLKLGFNSAYIRYYSRYKEQNNDTEIARLNGMFMTIFSVISLICFFCGIMLVANIDKILGKGLINAEINTARVLMTFMVINMILSFITSVFSCYLTAHEEFIFQKTLNVVQGILNPFLALPLLLLGYGSIGMVSATTFLTVAALICSLYYCFKYLQMHFIFYNFKFILLKEMWVFTFFIFLNQIVDQVNWNVDKFLLGNMVGTKEVAIYGLGAQINTMYIAFSTAISSVFTPEINRIVAKTNDNEELTELFTRVGRIQFLVLGLILTGYIAFGKVFMIIWGGRDYKRSYYVVLWLIIPETIALIQNLGLEIQRAKNMHKARSVVYVIIAIINIFVSIRLIRKWGASGAAMGTAISLIVGNMLFMNWYYYKKIQLDIPYFWKETLKLLPAQLICLIVGFIISYFIEITNWGSFCICIALYFLFYITVLWHQGMNTDEKGLIKGMLKK